MEKVALITGGSRGIGLGIAIELAKSGFDLAINGVRDESAVIEILEDLKKFGVQIAYFQGDVSKKEDRVSMMSAILNRFGKVNILVNNAGISPKERKDILEATEESFEHLINVNLQEIGRAHV